jgi:hypothetical protein
MHYLQFAQKVNAINYTMSLIFELAIARGRMHCRLKAENLLVTIKEHQTLEKHNKRVMTSFNVKSRRLFRLMINSLHTNTGSLFLAQAMETQNKQDRDRMLALALYKLEQGQQFDNMSGILKLAMFHYVIGDHLECLNIIKNALESADVHVMIMSGSVDGPYNPIYNSGYIPLNMYTKDMLRRFYAFEFSCSAFEFNYKQVPYAMKYEIATVSALSDALADEKWNIEDESNICIR